MGDIPGFKATITLNGNEFTAYLNDLSLARTRNVMSKSTMDGSGDPRQLAGQITGTLSLNGQIDSVGLAVLENTWVQELVFPWSLEVGPDNEGVEAGSYSGNGLVTDFSQDAAASDSWNFSMSLNTSGEVTFVPPA